MAFRRCTMMALDAATAQPILRYTSNTSLSPFPHVPRPATLNRRSSLERARRLAVGVGTSSSSDRHIEIPAERPPCHVAGTSRRPEQAAVMLLLLLLRQPVVGEDGRSGSRRRADPLRRGASSAAWLSSRGGRWRMVDHHGWTRPEAVAGSQAPRGPLSRCPSRSRSRHRPISARCRPTAPAGPGPHRASAMRSRPFRCVPVTPSRLSISATVAHPQHGRRRGESRQSHEPARAARSAGVRAPSTSGRNADGQGCAPPRVCASNIEADRGISDALVQATPGQGPPLLLLPPVENELRRRRQRGNPGRLCAVWRR